MRYCIFLVFASLGIPSLITAQPRETNFPDGTVIPAWFQDYKLVDRHTLGRQYDITRHGVKHDSTRVQTTQIQKIIDKAARKGGGVIVIPKGTFLSGALFFKPNTHLYIADGGVLKGSDDIRDYPIMPSRMEGQNLEYFPALVNAYNLEGFTISGKGIIDGNGLAFWKAFWQRREENPECTNLEVSRPRLVFMWNSRNVQVQEVTLRNAGFWTSHYYKCSYVKILNVTILSPRAPVKAPSTDAIDLDACSNVLIKGCYLSVNDDAIALKGGKGPYADTNPDNGENTNILIEDCEFGFCHAALTFGSEAIHTKNVLMRNCHVNDAQRLLWLKLRPDTPQRYEYITLNHITGQANSMIYVKPWTQFFDLQGRKDVPLSYADNIMLRNMDFICDVFFDVAITEHDKLSNFKFERLTVKAEDDSFNREIVNGLELTGVYVNGAELK